MLRKERQRDCFARFHSECLNDFPSKLKMIKDADSKFEDSISPKTRQILLHWD